MKAWQFPCAGWACSKLGFLSFRARPRAGHEEPGPDSPRPLPVLWAAPSSLHQLPRRRRSCCVTFALPRLVPPRGPQLQRLPPFACRPLAWKIIPRPQRPGGEGGEALRPAAHPGSSAGSSPQTCRGRVGRAAFGPHCLQDQELEGGAQSAPVLSRVRKAAAGARARAPTERPGARVNPSVSGGWGAATRAHPRPLPARPDLLPAPPSRLPARRVRGHRGRGGRHGESPAPPRARNSLADSAHTQLQGLAGRTAAGPPVQVTRARGRARTHT